MHGVAFASGDARARPPSSWFGRRRLNREAAFGAGFSVSGFDVSDCSLADSSPSAGAAVVVELTRERPRVPNPGRGRTERWVELGCADVSMAFSSGLFSSAVTAAAVVFDPRRLKRLRAEMEA